MDEIPPVEPLPDPLHARYATDWMAWLWTDDRRFMVQRAVWLAIASQQSQHQNTPLATEDLIALTEVVGEVDAKRVRERERTVHHETKAHIEEWLAVASAHAGRPVHGLHLGLTSGDVVEAADWVRQATAAVLTGIRMRHISIKLAQLASTYADLPCVGRTHTQPAQPLTLGYRIATWLEQWRAAFIRLGDSQPRIRQFSGAVGTYADQIQLMHPEYDGYEADDTALLCVMGLMRGAIMSLIEPGPWGSILTGTAVTWRVASQVNPRHDELARVAALRQMSQVADTIGTNIRLMVHEGIADERPPAGTVGSSAMPHKNEYPNPRLSEQLHSLAAVMAGYCTMADQAAGPQWYEGDVTTSAARRVYLPGLWLTADAICNTLWHVLDRLEFDETEVREQYEHWLPELSTGAHLAALVRGGMDREQAHQAVRDGQSPGIDQDKLRALTGAAEYLAMAAVGDTLGPEDGSLLDVVWRDPA